MTAVLSDQSLDKEQLLAAMAADRLQDIDPKAAAMRQAKAEANGSAGLVGGPGYHAAGAGAAPRCRHPPSAVRRPPMRRCPALRRAVLPYVRPSRPTPRAPAGPGPALHRAGPDPSSHPRPERP